MKLFVSVYDLRLEVVLKYICNKKLRSENLRLQTGDRSLGSWKEAVHFLESSTYKSRALVTNNKSDLETFCVSPKPPDCFVPPNKGCKLITLYRNIILKTSDGYRRYHTKSHPWAILVTYSRGKDLA